jgi:hypothetical protein
MQEVAGCSTIGWKKSMQGVDAGVHAVNAVQFCHVIT